MCSTVANFIELCLQINSRDYLESNQEIISPQKLSELKQKSEDKNLYLGIVGEFSSGKSTLINAILRQYLLKEDILQGTTCAPTFIQYGKDFDIVIKYVNGQEFSYRLEHPRDSFQTLNFETGAIRDFIDKFTAEEKYSSKLERVTIFLDNPILQNNFVIVDTPGINSDNKRHSTVTKQTLEKHCDAAIILTPANAPCSEMLCGFVKEHLSGLGNRCIGIVSKIDSINTSSQQDRQLEFVKQRFLSELSKPLAAVLPVSAIYSQGQNPNEEPISQEMAIRYRQLFIDFENTIRERLISGRKAILAQSLRESLLKTISTLQNTLEILKTDLLNRKQTLENNQLTDVASFLNSILPEYQQDFDSFCSQYPLGDVEFVFHNARHKAKNKLQNILANCQNKNDLEILAYQSLRKKCKKAQKKVIAKLVEIQSLFMNWGSNVSKDFLEKFDSEFRHFSHDVQSSPIENSVITPSSAQSLQITYLFERNLMTKGPGHTIKKILQTPLAEGLFQIVQAYTDSSFSFFSTNNIQSVKNDVREAMRPILKKFFKKLSRSKDKSYFNIVNQTRDVTFNYITQTVRQYEPSIKQIIEQEKQDILNLEVQHKSITEDLNSLHQYELDFSK